MNDPDYRVLHLIRIGRLPFTSSPGGFRWLRFEQRLFCRLCSAIRSTGVSLGERPGPVKSEPKGEPIIARPLNPP
jgi:hypothetical protein